MQAVTGRAMPLTEGSEVEDQAIGQEVPKIGQRVSSREPFDRLGSDPSGDQRRNTEAENTNTPRCKEPVSLHGFIRSHVDEESAPDGEEDAIRNAIELFQFA